MCAGLREVAESIQYPLDGIRVLDFSRIVAGPFAGRLLADLGADVVKVEPPEGDGTRIQGRKVQGISGFFNQQNAGKFDQHMDLGIITGQCVIPLPYWSMKHNGRIVY